MKFHLLPDWCDKPLSQVSEILEAQGVRQAIDCVDWPNEFPYKPITSFYIARDKECLYINYFVKGNYLRAVNSTDNSPVWEDSCVEFFVQIPSEKYYYNFEFNCIGTALAARRTGREDAEHFSADKMAKIKRYSSVGNKPFCEMEGLFSWNLLVAIPFELIGLDGGQLPESLSANFYKCADRIVFASLFELVADTYRKARFSPSRLFRGIEIQIENRS